jgi:hypothetical protein
MRKSSTLIGSLIDVFKAHQRVSILFRGFLSRNTSTMRLAFITYIRPTLEYNSIIWNPSQKYLNL